MLNLILYQTNQINSTPIKVTTHEGLKNNFKYYKSGHNTLE